MTISPLTKTERQRNCLICNTVFYPRLYQIKTGRGKYCSIDCRNKGNLPSLMTEDAKRKSKETYMNNLAKGLIKHPTGKDHPRWLGGDKEMCKRRISSGRANNSTKKYRSKNTDKVREWSVTRHNRKTGRLPRGTVKSKIELQNGLCVYCKCDITTKYHVDHIIPLSKNGTHTPDNIQILCPTCNVRKWAKLDFNLEVK